MAQYLAEQGRGPARSLSSFVASWPDQDASLLTNSPCNQSPLTMTLLPQSCGHPRPLDLPPRQLADSCTAKLISHLLNSPRAFLAVTTLPVFCRHCRHSFTTRLVTCDFQVGPHPPFLNLLGVLPCLAAAYDALGLQVLTTGQPSARLNGSLILISRRTPPLQRGLLVPEISIWTARKNRVDGSVHRIIIAFVLSKVSHNVPPTQGLLVLLFTQIRQSLATSTTAASFEATDKQVVYEPGPSLNITGRPTQQEQHRGQRVLGNITVAS